MQFETTDSTCALCKSAFAPSADAYPGPSRLCRPCQQMVQTILPRVGLQTGSVAAPAIGALFEAAPAAGEAIYQDDAEDSLTRETGFDYAEAIEPGESNLFRPEEESYYKTELEIQPDIEDDDFVEDFPGAPNESLAHESLADDLSAHVSLDFSPSDSIRASEAASTVDQASIYDTEAAVPEAWENVTQVYGAQPASDYLPPITTPLTGETNRDIARDDLWSDAVETKRVESNTVETNTIEIGPVAAPAQNSPAQNSSAQNSSAQNSSAQGYDQAATDPWDNPLPAWDYSNTEYPVLLGPRKDTNRTKLWMPIAAGLLIGLLIAGYFLLSQPSAPQNQDQNSLAEPNTDSTPTAAEGDSTPVAPRQQNVIPQASADTPPAEAPQPAASTEFGSHGGLTLQSAAFPDEAGANDFSVKLIRAGIPAYVVPADLPRKGRWFRVRVGRFTNADDAKRYAAQSRLRAKAAGMDLSFMVVEYGKP